LDRFFSVLHVRPYRRPLITECTIPTEYNWFKKKSAPVRHSGIGSDFGVQKL